jgi:DUF2075 family protein
MLIATAMVHRCPSPLTCTTNKQCGAEKPTSELYCSDESQYGSSVRRPSFNIALRAQFVTDCFRGGGIRRRTDKKTKQSRLISFIRSCDALRKVPSTQTIQGLLFVFWAY